MTSSLSVHLTSYGQLSFVSSSSLQRTVRLTFRGCRFRTSLSPALDGVLFLRMLALLFFNAGRRQGLWTGLGRAHGIYDLREQGPIPRTVRAHGAVDVEHAKYNCADGPRGRVVDGGNSVLTMARGLTCLHIRERSESEGPEEEVEERVDIGEEWLGMGQRCV